MKDMSHRETVLVVDDEPTERRLLYHALKGEYRVLEAVDGPSALAHLRREAIDLVILDLHLPPDLETPSVAIRIHETIRRDTPRIPIVIATGNPDPSLRRDVDRRGVSDYLLKPVEPAYLRHVVSRALVSRCS